MAQTRNDYVSFDDSLTKNNQILTLEEIQASTDLSGKIASASSIAVLNSSLMNRCEILYSANVLYNSDVSITCHKNRPTIVYGARTNNAFMIIVPPNETEYPSTVLNTGVLKSMSKNGNNLSISIGNGTYGSNIHIVAFA